jgi:hypothetical protein
MIDDIARSPVRIAGRCQEGVSRECIALEPAVPTATGKAGGRRPSVDSLPGRCAQVPCPADGIGPVRPYSGSIPRVTCVSAWNAGP